MWQRVNESGNVAQRIVAQVERLLTDESLKPGDRLPAEREMAQLLGASRPSLREAVRVLQAQGRLIVKHGQGVFVAEPRSEQALRSALGTAQISINELFAMRDVLEVPAAGWAAEHITRAHVVELEQQLTELDAAFTEDPDDFQRLAALDAGFHLRIAAIARNRFLHQTSHVLHDILMSGMQTTLLIPGRRQKSQAQHQRILRALAEHDATGARRAARVHIRSAHQAALARIAAERPDDTEQASA